MKDTDGLLYKYQHRLDHDDLQWLQDENGRVLRAHRKGRMASPGLIVARSSGGSLEDNWKVHDDDDDGILTVVADVSSLLLPSMPAVATAIDADGYLIPLPEDSETVTVPNDATWYTLVVRRVTTKIEPGTWTVTTGSAAVVGVGTEFTRYAGYTTDAAFNGTKVRIDAGDTANGNDGTYEIDTITDDTHLTLRQAVNGTNESGLLFRVAGDFAQTTPADPDIHQRTEAEFELVALTRSPATGDFALCDVKRDDAAGPPKCTIIDRRGGSLYRAATRTNGQWNGIEIQPRLTFDTGSPFTAAAADVNQIAGIAGTGMVKVSLAPAEDDNLLVVLGTFDGVVTYDIRSYHFDHTTNTWALSVDVDVTGGATNPTLSRLPSGSGATHIVVYNRANKLWSRTSPDNGTTWSAESGASIWDGTGLDPLDVVDEPALLLLLSGRLLLAASYHDDTPAAGLDPDQVRVIYSDDWGATWSTNGNAGWTARAISPAVAATKPALGQGPDGRIWLGYVEAGNEVRLAYSTSDTGTAWFASTLSGTQTAITGDTQTAPTLWVGPEGQVVVLYDDSDAGGNYSGVRYAVFVFQGGALVMTWDRALIAAEDSTNTSRVNPSACQTRSGGLHLAFSQYPGGNNVLTHLPLVALPQPLAPRVLFE